VTHIPKLIAPILIATVASAQMPTDARVPSPVRRLGAAVTSVEALRSLAAVRELSNGSVLVNDQAGRRVLLMDSSLKVLGVVADSTSSTASAYGAWPGGLMPYRGDSTLFVDPASLSMLVIDPSGKIARVMAAPRPDDVMALVGGPFGNAGFDARGRLIYRSLPRPRLPPGTNGAVTPPVLPDSAALMRFDLVTRRLDTVAYMKISRPSVNVMRDDNGAVRVTTSINPLPVVDEWAVLSDGTLAIVRGRDYHVELITADGTGTVANKIPYEWQRLTDEDKVAFIDSTKAAMERQRAAGVPMGIDGGGGMGAGGAVMFSRARPSGASGSGGETTVRVGPGGPDGPRPAGPGGSSGAMSVQPGFVSPSELPDYKPVFGPGAVRADVDGRVWVRTIPTKPAPGPIYEVIDHTGKRVDRVMVPSGTTIVGFGKGGVVYLGMRDAAGVHIQRARISGA
jgi:hypothetical protein